MARVVNPYAAAILEREGDAIVGLTVRAPLRGRGLQCLRAHHERDRALFQILFSLLVRRGPAPVLDGELADRLALAGVLALPDELPRQRPERFRCPIDAPPGALANASEIAGRVGDLSSLSPARPIAWVEDPATGALLPYWPDPSAPPAPTGPAASDPEVVREELARDRFAVFQRVLPPLQVAALARYYRALAEEGFFQHGDGDSRRWVLENDGVARFFQRALLPLMARIAGEPLRPSFAYVAAYHHGDDLPVHRDRPQCDLALSLLVDHDPAPAARSPWPLYFTTPRGEVPCHQGVGDVILYRGRDLPHRRAPLPDRRSISLFLFYVPRDFSGPLD